MKKTLFLLPLAALLSLSACTSSEDNMTSTVNLNAINIITSLSDGTTVATKGGYSATLTINNQTGIINSGVINFNNASLQMTSNVSKYISSGYDAYFKDISGSATSGMSLEMTNGNFLITPYYYPILQDNMDYLKYSLAAYPFYGNTVNKLAASYELGGQYLIRTFQEDTFYVGTTTTNGSASANTGIIYRVLLDVASNAATIIMYNAKFSDSPMEPLKEAIIAKGLKATYSQEGITISGEDIIPDMVEGTSVTPVPNFKFNEINFKTTGNMLLNCQINFKVADIYSGNFIGSYIYDEIIKE